MAARSFIQRLAASAGSLASVRRLYRTVVGFSRNLLWRLDPCSLKEACGFSVPPPDLCFAAANSYDPEQFVSSGRKGMAAVTKLLELTGRSPDEFHSILDFGCGCCRLTRYFPVEKQGQSITGADINGRAVRWVNREIDHIRALTTHPGKPLPFSPGTFDLILAVAVFPWFRTEEQVFYMKELHRVMCSGGMLLLTLKGESRLNELTDEEADVFRSGLPVVREPESSGSPYCIAYTPKAHFASRLVQGFKLLRHVPDGSADTVQDAYLLLKS